MNDLDVRIVQLGPMRVASFHGFGPGPELEAAKKLADWAKPLGLLDAEGTHRVFGFNNPDPSPGSPNYGYEFWIDIGPDYETKNVTIKDFPGGLYAVTHCRGVENISLTWKKLAAWRAASSYELSPRQWLEEHLGPRPFSATETDLEMDLYLSVKES